MDIPLKVEFKMGQIEFKAEGNADDVEKQRDSFVNTLFPLAVEAMLRNRNIIGKDQQYIEESNEQTQREAPQMITSISTMDDQLTTADSNVDFSRESLNTYINKFGTITDQEFVVLSAYFQEIKTGETISITSETIKQYYKDARRVKYSNVSQLLSELVKKGLLKDDEDSEKKIPKPYILTNDGIKYAKEFTPKSNIDSKSKATKSKATKSKATKSRKPIAKIVSIYSELTVDDLNIKKYPEIKSRNGFKDQMILIMYIVSSEGKGDTFSVIDIQYLLTEMLGLPATNDQIRGVIKTNKSWFKSEKDLANKKAYRYKLLQGAKDFAEAIINE